MALRRVREGSGSYQSGPGQDQWIQQVPDMVALLTNIPFVLIGGLATRLYMPERVTMDVDVLVHADDLEAAGESLRRQGAEWIGPLSIGGATWRLKDGRMIDLIAVRADWLEAALKNPRLGPDGQPYVDLPWLVLLKLSASRSQDLADITRMLGAADARAIENVKVAVSRHRPNDLEDVESLIRLGRLETGKRE